MRAVIFFIFFPFILASCTKNTINEDAAGEIYSKYAGDYTAAGSQIRYRVGIDTTTSVDTFDMTIVKFMDTGMSGDSEFTESKISIENFFGSGITISANATYYHIYPFAVTALPNLKNIEINSETNSIFNYSYYKVNGPQDTSWFSGKANKIK